MLLENKVALVTGGAMGLGEATAIQYARQGARVIIADVNEQAQQTATAIRAAGGEACFVPTDIASAAAVEHLMGLVREEFGRLDVLVNCAAILLSPHVRVDQFEEADWDRVLEINLKGTFLCVKHAVPLMEEKGGIIFCVASGAGISGASSSVAYSASKGGVQGLVFTLRHQLEALNIRVHVFLPPNMGTPMRVGAVGEVAEREGRSRAAAEAAERASLPAPDDTAALLAELASEAGERYRDQMTLAASEFGIA